MGNVPSGADLVHDGKEKEGKNCVNDVRQTEPALDYPASAP